MDSLSNGHIAHRREHGVLWFAGSDLEDVLGAGKFLALYFLSGFASALLFGSPRGEQFPEYR